MTPSDAQAHISARIERLPITRPVFWLRNVVGAATFFDGYTVLAIAYAMPVLVREWQLSPQQVGLILSAGYLGQLAGAVFFGWLAERIGRLRVLTVTITLFVAMDVACLFAWDASSMMLFRFVQGIGTGGEVPVASAYISEFAGAKQRGRFFLLYEGTFLVGLIGAGLIGYLLVPAYGWKAMFAVGLVPAILLLPLRWFMPESPRWLAANGRYPEADEIVARLERSALARGKLPPHDSHDGVIAGLVPATTRVEHSARPSGVAGTKARSRASSDALFPATTPPVVEEFGSTEVRCKSGWRELFAGIYLKRTLTIWTLWFCAYLVANGTSTWLPTLYREAFGLPLEVSLRYGLLTSVAGVAAAIICALSIDRIGRRRWYMMALAVPALPLLTLAGLGATSATQVVFLAGLAYAILQTVTFSLYLYSAELYPTRLRAVGAGLGGAWQRLGSSAGPLLVGWIIAGFGIRYVFALFAIVLLFAAIVTVLFAIETKGRALEELSP